MPPADPYVTLGVPPDASIKAVRKAYRALALKHHPDRNPSDVDRATEILKQLNLAFAAIGTAEARARYESTQRAARAAQVARDVRAWQNSQAAQGRPAPRTRRRPKPRATPRPTRSTPRRRPEPFAPSPPPWPAVGLDDLPPVAASEYPDEGRMPWEVSDDWLGVDDYAAEGGAVDFDDDEG